MMKPLAYKLFLTLFLISKIASAQDVNSDTHTITIGFPQVIGLSLLSDTGTNITLNGKAPTKAGDAAIFNDTNSDLWINYSCSIIGTSVEPTKNIDAQITQGTVPEGLVLSVIASSDVGEGDGTIGIPTSIPVILNHLSKTIIDGVGVSYTGSGTNKGHNLTYALTLNTTGTYGLIDFDQAQTLSVTYTLSDN